MLERTTKQSNKLYHSYKATFEVIHAFQLFWYTCFYINCNYDIPTFLYHPFFDFKWYKCFRCYIIFILYEIFNSFVLIHWVNYMNFLTSSFKGIYAECTHTVPVCLLSKYIQDCLACCCITLFVTGHTLSLSVGKVLHTVHCHQKVFSQTPLAFWFWCLGLSFFG